MDIVGNLLPELAQRIILYLSSEEIENVWNGIEEWRHLIDNYVWKQVCNRTDYHEKEGYLTSNIYREFMSESSVHWRAIYKYNQLIESNWSDGNFKFVSMEKYKEYDGINYFDDEILVVNNVCSDTEINVDIIDLSTGKVLFSFTEEKTVREAIKHEDLLIFVNFKTLKVWNLKTKSWLLDVELEKTEVFSQYPVLDIYKNRLAFIHSPDCYYIVNLDTKQVSFKNDRNVGDLSFGDNIIILLSKDVDRIIIVDLEGESLMEIDYPGKLQIQQILTKGGYVIVYFARVDDDIYQKVSIYTIQQDTKELKEFNSIYVLYSNICFPNNNTMLFWTHKTYRRRIRCTLWKFGTKNSTTVFDNDERDLQSVAANNSYMFVCIDDTLTMWCLETGKFIRIISDKALKNSHTNLKLTENKLAYLNCDKLLCIQNYDFIESKIDVSSQPESQP